jgi:hypothetical protein
VGAIVTYLAVGDRVVAFLFPDFHSRTWTAAATFVAGPVAPLFNKCCCCCRARASTFAVSFAASILKRLHDMAENRERHAKTTAALSSQAPAAVCASESQSPSLQAPATPSAVVNVGDSSASQVSTNPLSSMTTVAPLATKQSTPSSFFNSRRQPLRISASPAASTVHASDNKKPDRKPTKPKKEELAKGWIEKRDESGDVWYEHADGRSQWEHPGWDKQITWARQTDEIDIWFRSSEGEVAWNLPPGAILV